MLGTVPVKVLRVIAIFDCGHKPNQSKICSYQTFEYHKTNIGQEYKWLMHR